MKDYKKIGIVGCGHLGQALAQGILKSGVQKSDIMLSHSNSKITQMAIEDAGLTECIASNEFIFQSADIVFLCVRPQDVAHLQIAGMKNRIVIASCIAGLSIDALKNKFQNGSVIRLMPSSPYSIAAKQAICAIYPEDTRVHRLLQDMSFAVFSLREERELAIFTASVCLPTVLLANPISVLERNFLVEQFSKECSHFSMIYEWAENVVPVFETGEERRDYLRKVATKGGITETILKSLETGASLALSMHNGVARSFEISEEISESR